MGTNVKEYICLRAKKGREGETWAKAESLLLQDTVTGRPPKQATEVKAIWTEEALLVHFLCEDIQIRANLTQFNQPLYEEDVVEIFLDPRGEGREYMEFEVNPHNAVLHYYIQNNREQGLVQYAALKNHVASSVNFPKMGRQEVYLEIPFFLFGGAPQKGERWRANFYRIDRGVCTEEDEYSAWSPTGKEAFHIPERFGRLVFDGI